MFFNKKIFIQVFFILFCLMILFRIGLTAQIFTSDNYSYKDISKIDNGEAKPIHVEKVKQIILKTGDDIIGQIWNLQAYKDKLLVVDTIYSRKCYLFDYEGTLLDKVGRNGEGPGEYLLPRAACISGDRIFVAGVRRINIYTLKGENISTANLPFKSICNGLNAGKNGEIYASSFNRYNKKKNSIFRLDKDCRLIKAFAPIDDIPYVFDTFAPQTVLCITRNKIYQVVNFKQEISLFTITGDLIKNINFTSPLYTLPDFARAQKVKGHKEELKFRATFSQVTGIFKIGNGFVTQLTNWKDRKNGQFILEFWDNNFKRKAYFEFSDYERVLAVYNDMLITEFIDEDSTKLSFWKISF